MTEDYFRELVNMPELEKFSDTSEKITLLNLISGDLFSNLFTIFIVKKDCSDVYKVDSLIGILLEKSEIIVRSVNFNIPTIKRNYYNVSFCGREVPVALNSFEFEKKSELNLILDEYLSILDNTLHKKVYSDFVPDITNLTKKEKIKVDNKKEKLSIIIKFGKDFLKNNLDLNYKPMYYVFNDIRFYEGQDLNLKREETSEVIYKLPFIYKKLNIIEE